MQRKNKLWPIFCVVLAVSFCIAGQVWAESKTPGPENLNLDEWEDYNPRLGSEQIPSPLETLIKQAKAGDASAQYDLGHKYFMEQGVPSDVKKAAFWCTKAVEQGYAPAQYMLGVLYYNGQGVPQDYKKAAYLYIKAAEQGNRHAQLQIGSMYHLGKGVSQDYPKALYWYTKGAENGPAAVQYFMGSMYDSDDIEITDRDYNKAAYWFAKSAEQGFAESQARLGLMYAQGHGVPQDYKQAVYWYTKAAEQGHAGAQSKLGWMYDDGKGVLQDYKKAVYWYKKAAEQGGADAQYNLGVMYGKGRGVPQNYIYAYVWSSLAAVQGGQAESNRSLAASFLTSQQLIHAQELAAKIQYEIDHPSEAQEPHPSIQTLEKKVTGSGTGFIITRNGYVLTCHHVIDHANEVKVAVGGKIYPAKLIRSDPNNDLALLKINGSFPAIGFSSKRSAKMGQNVFTIGYPNPGLQGVSAKFTKGTINSLTGVHDDLRLYQISVPVQPGNSGGPLLDENGNILGIIVAMLDAKTAFEISGSLPQNVNYAVKSIYAQAMLDTLPEISNKLIGPSKSKSNAVDRVKKSTVLVLSYK